LVIRDLDLYSTDEHGNKCDLKRARAFSKDHDDVSYSFKEGSCLLSIFLSPANPWSLPHSLPPSLSNSLPPSLPPSLFL
jgi:hypothetical protein